MGMRLAIHYTNIGMKLGIHYTNMYWQKQAQVGTANCKILGWLADTKCHTGESLQQAIGWVCLVQVQ